MESVATGELDLPSLPAAARSCYKSADITEPFVSVKKIVNSGCSVLFKATNVTIKDKTTGKQVLEKAHSTQTRISILFCYISQRAPPRKQLKLHSNGSKRGENTFSHLWYNGL